MASIFLPIKLFFAGLPDWVKKLLAYAAVALTLVLLFKLAMSQFNSMLEAEYKKGLEQGIELQKNVQHEKNNETIALLQKDIEALRASFADGMNAVQAGQKVAETRTAAILARIKTQPAWVVQNGKCVPTKEATASWNEIISTNRVQ